MAGKLDITIEQGTTYRRRITRKVKATGDIISMVGWTALMQLRKNARDTAILDELTTVNGRLVIETDGSITMNFPDNVTAAYVFATASYDLLVINPQGETKRLLAGKVTVVPGVTH